MRIWLLRCININAFCWCISVCLYKELPIFDKSTLLGYTRHLVVQVGYHHIISTSTFISSSFFSTPFTEKLMLLISIFLHLLTFSFEKQNFQQPSRNPALFKVKSIPYSNLDLSWLLLTWVNTTNTSVSNYSIY